VADIGDAESGSGGHCKEQRGEVDMLLEKEEDTKNTINNCRPA
jgi:hypothetical protein